MTHGEYLDRLIEQTVSGWTDRRGSERFVRCWECGDSDHEDHGHLGISLRSPFLFHCFRCNYSGSVSERFLKAMGVKVITPEMRQILDANREAVRLRASDKLWRRTELTKSILKDSLSDFKLKPPELQPVDLHGAAYDYICQRFACKFSAADLNLFKAVLNLKAFGRLNGIQSWTESVDTLNVLHSEYISFLDYAGSALIFRNTLQSNNPRYHEIHFSKSPYRFYTLASQVSVETDVLHLVIAEGIFDIIGLWLKYPKLRSRSVYCAMLGKGISGIIDYFWRLGFVKQSISIYSDSDVLSSSFKASLAELKFPREFGFSVNLYRNRLGHDYGVPSSKIDVGNPEILLR